MAIKRGQRQRAYNGSLVAEAPAGSLGQSPYPLVQKSGAKPSEAESLSFLTTKEGLNLSALEGFLGTFALRRI